MVSQGQWATPRGYCLSRKLRSPDGFRASEHPQGTGDMCRALRPSSCHPWRQGLSQDASPDTRAVLPMEKIGLFNVFSSARPPLSFPYTLAIKGPRVESSRKGSTSALRFT